MYQIPICNEELTIYGNPTEAYAVINRTDGTLTFFRDTPGKYTNKEEIDDKVYFTGLESANPSPDWAGTSTYTSLYDRVLMTGTIKPKNIDYWFNGMQLTSIDISLLDTSECTSMQATFDILDAKTGGYVNLDVSHFDTSNVTNMRDMFNATQVQTLDLSSFDTSNVIDMAGMFKDCMAETIYASALFDTSSVTNSTDMFLDATHIVGGNQTTYSSSHIDKEYARIDTASTPGYFTEKV